MDPLTEIDTLNPNKRKLIEVVTHDDEVLHQTLLKVASKDLYKFNKHILSAEKGDDKFVPLGEVHKKMCHFVQDDRHKKKLLLIPRNHLKTKLITVGYPLFRIAEDPKIRILIYSATWQMAVDIVSQIQYHLKGNERFIELFGDLATNPKEWSQDRVRLNISDKREPTVTAAGIDNNLVGGHYDLIIFDDVVMRDNIGTADQISKVNKRYNDSLDLLEPDGQVVVIGTRWHDSDLYGWILDPQNHVDKTYDIMIERAFEGSLQTDEGFTLLWPGKFTRQELLARANSEGWSHFSSQYLNDPVPEENAYFKKNYFNYYESPDLQGKILTRFLAVDPAISQEKTSDYTGMVVVGVDQFNYLYVLDILRERLLPHQIINYIFMLALKHQVGEVALEAIAYQKTLAYSLREEMRRRNKYLKVTEITSHQKSKEDRIKGLQPLYENGRVLHNRLHPNNFFLEDELLRFPRGSHDDVIDAFSFLLDIIYPARAFHPQRNSGRKYLY